jgi:AcrR family transcriptional regulator
VGTLYLYFKNKDDLIVACTGEFVERHRREIDEIVAAELPADEKIRRYVLSRFRAAEETRTGSRHAAELTRAVLRLKPERAVEEGAMMWDTLAKLLKQGVRERRFRLDSPEDDAKVFLFSIAYFFPNALTEPPIPPEEQDLLAVVEWFLKAWRAGGTRSRSLGAGRKSRRVGAGGAKRG